MKPRTLAVIGLVLLAMMILGAAAFAGTPAAPATDTSVSIAWLSDFFLMVATTVITGAVPIALAWLRTHLRVMRSATLQSLVADEASRGAGIAVNFLQTEAARYQTVNPRAMAAAIGLRHVMTTLPDVLKELGVTPTTVANQILGEMGKLLADPTHPAVLVDPGAHVPDLAPVAPPAPPAPPPPPAPPAAPPTDAQQAADLALSGKLPAPK